MSLRRRFQQAIARAYRRAIPEYPPCSDEDPEVRNRPPWDKVAPEDRPKTPTLAELGVFLLDTIRKDTRQRLVEADEPITLELTPDQFFDVLEALEERPHLRRTLETKSRESNEFWSLLMAARAAFLDKKHASTRARLYALGRVLRLVKPTRGRKPVDHEERMRWLAEWDGDTYEMHEAFYERFGVELESAIRSASRHRRRTQ